IVLGASSGTATGCCAQAPIAVDPSNLPAGTYTGAITLTSQATPATITIPVTLNISNLPLLTVPNVALGFTYQLGGSVPAAQTVAITATSASLAYTNSVSSNAPWLLVPPTGATPTPLSVTVNPAGLAAGSYSGT